MHIASMVQIISVNLPAVKLGQGFPLPFLLNLQKYVTIFTFHDYFSTFFNKSRDSLPFLENIKFSPEKFCKIYAFAFI